MFLFLRNILFSCVPCKDISQIQNLLDVEHSCAFPKNRQKMWTCSIPPPMSRLPKDLLALHEACSLHEFVDPQFFALNTGDSIRAAQIFFWLSQKKHPHAKELAMKALGKRIIPQEASIPIISVSQAPKISSWDNISILKEESNLLGAWGKYPYWHREATNKNTISISGTAPVQSLRYAMASREDIQSPLEIVVLDEYLTSLTLHPPTSARPEIVTKDESGWTPKTERDQLRLNISDEEKVSTVLEFIANHPNKTVEIAMAHIPCVDSIPNMTCLSGSTTHKTVYIDTNPIDDYSECQQSGFCSANKGTWYAAVEQCHFRGKSLPSPNDIYPFAEEQWAAQTDPISRLQKTTTGTILPKNTVFSSSLRCVQYLPPINTPISYPKQPIDTPELQKRIQQLLQQENISLDPLETKSWNYLFSTLDVHNEAKPYYKNLGGAYIGTADIVSFEHIVQARPERGFVIGDNHVQLQRLVILSSLIAQSKNIEDFLSIIESPQRTKTILSMEVQRNPKSDIVSIWDKESSTIVHAIQLMRKDIERQQEWTHNEDSFQFLKNLIRNQRLVLLSGRWDGKKTIPSIAQVLEELLVPVQMIYLGSWEEQNHSHDTHREQKNITSLPMTSQSVVFSQHFQGIRILDGLSFQDRVYNNTSLWWDIKKKKDSSLHVAGRVPVFVDSSKTDSDQDLP